METKPPLPPFTAETAAQKARMAEDAWNTRDPDGNKLCVACHAPQAVGPR